MNDPDDESSLLTAAVELSWIPLGAGEVVVRASGKVFEVVSAFVQRRRPLDLYHSALVVIVPDGRYVIEMAPVPDLHGERRGVVGEGPVGTRWAARFRPFRYEIRRWRDGNIPDLQNAIATVRVEMGVTRAQRLLDLVPSVPTPAWGRDELGAGEMWNSNSVTSWLLQRAGVETGQIAPPRNGRAPGWGAGLTIASRDLDDQQTLFSATDEQLVAEPAGTSERALLESSARSTDVGRLATG